MILVPLNNDTIKNDTIKKSIIILWSSHQYVHFFSFFNFSFQILIIFTFLS